MAIHNLARPKYPHKRAPDFGRPRRAEKEAHARPGTPAQVEDVVAPSVEDVALDPIPTLEELVARLKEEGYNPIHWIVGSKGVRAEAGGPAKVGVPSEYSKARVCLQHGNLVKLRQETFPERSDRGLRILDVLPCPFCTPDPVAAILRFPKTQ